MKKTWSILPVVLLAVLGMLITGCSAEIKYGDNIDSPEVVPPPQDFVFLLGDFTYIQDDDPSHQKGWQTDGLDGKVTGLEWAYIQEAKFLVLEMRADVDKYGFGDFQIILQGDGNSWVRGEIQLTNLSWENYQTDTTSYFVVQFDQIPGFGDFIAGTEGRIFFGYYASPIDDLGIKNAYLTDRTITKPISGPIIDFIVSRGFIAKELDSDFGYNPTFPQGFVFNLGNFTWVNAGSPDVQKGWQNNGLEGKKTNLEWAYIQEAKFLVLETKTDVDMGGFGAIQIIIMGDGNGWGWGEVELTSGMVSYQTDTTSYIVIDLGNIPNFNTFKAGTEGRIIIAYYSLGLDDLGIRNAFLTGKTVTRPTSGDVVNLISSYGFIAKELVYQ